MAEKVLAVAKPVAEKLSAVEAFPLRLEVITLAEKSPFPSLDTIEFARFEELAVVAELETFPEVEIVASLLSATLPSEIFAPEKPPCAVVVMERFPDPSHKELPETAPAIVIVRLPLKALVDELFPLRGPEKLAAEMVPPMVAV